MNEEGRKAFALLQRELGARLCKEATKIVEQHLAGQAGPEVTSALLAQASRTFECHYRAVERLWQHLKEE